MGFHEFFYLYSGGGEWNGDFSDCNGDDKNYELVPEKPKKDRDVKANLKRNLQVISVMNPKLTIMSFIWFTNQNRNHWHLRVLIEGDLLIKNASKHFNRGALSSAPNECRNNWCHFLLRDFHFMTFRDQKTSGHYGWSAPITVYFS